MAKKAHACSFAPLNLRSTISRLAEKTSSRNNQAFYVTGGDRPRDASETFRLACGLEFEGIVLERSDTGMAEDEEIECSALGIGLQVPATSRGSREACRLRKVYSVSTPDT